MQSRGGALVTGATLLQGFCNPSSDQQSQAPGGISDMTCAEVPLSSVAQVKAQIGKHSPLPLIVPLQAITLLLCSEIAYT